MKYSVVHSRFDAMLLILVMSIALIQQKSFAQTCPCDIYASGGTPCVAAHSTVRALYGSYKGPLYQVRRASDNKTLDVGLLSPGGVANTVPQDSFCKGTTAVITVIYDQSGKGNDLWYQGSTVVPGSPQSSPAKATTENLNVNGHKVYSLYINPGNSYWRDGSKTGVPTGSQPEAMYMVTSGTHYNNGCCFDYGNSETTRKADAAGAMDALNFTSQCWTGHQCQGKGPWIQADLEWGLFNGANSSNPENVPQTSKYVTAILKNNGTTKFALKGGNAQSGNLTKLYEGKLPNGYSPMVKQGAIVLGSGGDCCKPDGGANASAGTFYEGAITSGYPSDSIDNLVQANIVAAGYGSNVSVYNPFSSGNKKGIQSCAIKAICIKSILRIEFTAHTDGMTALKLYDMKGVVVGRTELYTRSNQLYSCNFDMLKRSNGNYIVRITNGENTFSVLKVPFTN